MQLSTCAICDEVAWFGFTQMAMFEKRSEGSEGEIRANVQEKCFRQSER